MEKILKTIVDNLTIEERKELEEYLKSCSYNGNVTRPDNSQNNTEILKCPKCGSLGPLSQGISMRTNKYYEPVWEHGINLNPDGNITTTKFTCEKCGCDFVAKFQYGKCIDVKPLFHDIKKIRSKHSE